MGIEKLLPDHVLLVSEAYNPPIHPAGMVLVGLVTAQSSQGAYTPASITHVCEEIQKKAVLFGGNCVFDLHFSGVHHGNAYHPEDGSMMAYGTAYRSADVHKGDNGMWFIGTADKL